VRRAAPGDVQVRSWLSVVRVYNQCEALMARRLAPLGVRPAEHEILVNLRREPGLTQQALAQRCFTAKSHISTLLSALQERGWVRRESDPTDARAKRLYLQPAGEQMAERSLAVQSQVIAAMADGSSPSEMTQLAELMARLSQRLQALSDERDAATGSE
jgi:DNA-binding MarR family transcriptional regulator